MKDFWSVQEDQFKKALSKHHFGRYRRVRA
jgi:hypothetical protein